MSLLLYVIAVVVIFLIYKLLTASNDYFERKGIPYLKPRFFVGSRSDLILRNRSMPDVIKSWYNEFRNAKVIGLFEFQTPAYVVRDPKLLKKLAVKDFESFLDHKMILNEDVDPLFGRALFSLKGQKWRDMRATLSPAFTGSKMRQMFELMSHVGQQAAETMKVRIQSGTDNVYEFKDLARKFTVDVIATCAFGIEVNSFQNDKNDFMRIAGKLANFGSFVSMLKFMGFFAAPKLMHLLRVRFFDKETNDFFREAITETIKVREDRGIVRHDMIELLIQAKKGKLTHEKEKDGDDASEGFATVQESQVGKSEVKTVWSEDDLTAQCFIFFFAGFDTVSTVMTFMAYELIANPDIQRKLQEEIDEVNNQLNGSKIDYNKIQGMKYLDQVVSETLRKWPPAPAVDRLCVKDYDFEYDNIKFTMEKDKNFYIPIVAIHHDPEYYPNPDKFDPERFSNENRNNIDPDTYIPFGIGPRNCIGSRFALMEVKVIFYHLLLNFDFEVTKKTQIPIKLASNPAQLQTEKGVWVGFKPRNRD